MRSGCPSHTQGTFASRSPRSFVWKATADDIRAKVQRRRKTLHQIKTQTDH